MAQELASFVHEYGVNIVGGCCGSTPEHIRELVAQRRRAAPRGSRTAVDAEPRLASSMHAIELRQQPPPLLIGERVNAQGSRAVKRLLLPTTTTVSLGVARTQVEGGAHALDVCVAVTERSDEAEQMRAVVKTLQMSVDAPLVIDSTDADVIEAALEAYPGRGIVNSVNLENGRAALRRGAAARARPRRRASSPSPSTSRAWRAPRSASSRSPGGSTTSRATSTALRAAPADLRRAHLHARDRRGRVDRTRRARRSRASAPSSASCRACSPCSACRNVSFGLAPHTRPVLNSVFLHHCVEAGLDAAIINPTHVVPYAEIDPQSAAPRRGPRLQQRAGRADALHRPLRRRLDDGRHGTAGDRRSLRGA